jgi:hypothetical protein
VSGNAVGIKFRRYGVPTRTPAERQCRQPPKPHKPPIWFDEAVRLYNDEELSFHQVALRIGLSDRRITDLFRREKVTLRPRTHKKLTDDQRNDVVLLHARGMTNQWIADTLKISEWSVRNALDHAPDTNGQAGSASGEGAAPMGENGSQPTSDATATNAIISGGALS